MTQNPAHDLVERLLEMTHAAPAAYRVHDTLVIVTQIPQADSAPQPLPEQLADTAAHMPPTDIDADTLRQVCSNAIRGGGISQQRAKDLLGKRIDEMDAPERSAAHARISAALEGAQ